MPSTHAASICAAVLLAACAARAGEQAGPAANSAEKTLAEVTPQLSFDAEKSMVHIAIPGFPDLGCETYCYEDSLGKAVENKMDGKNLVLVHKNPKLEGVTVTSTFKPSPGGVEQVVTVEGPSAEAVRGVAFVNPCVQFQNAAAFGRRQDWKSDYVADFVGRCFVFLEGGFTLLKDAKRVPGTMPVTYEHAAKVNGEKPWIQEYVPVWEKHFGQQKGERGWSTDRPVYPIIGVVSYDGKNLAALAWPETSRLGQVWMYCIHPRPCVLTTHEPGAKKFVSRGKFYFMPNDGKALLAAFEKDYPGWKALAEKPTVWK